MKKKGAKTSRKTLRRNGRTAGAPAKRRANKQGTAKRSAPRSRSKKTKKPVQGPTKTQQAPVKRRIVVAGGTGFIGTHVCHELAQRGYHIIILTKGESKQTGHDNETTVHWDGTDVNTLLPYVDGSYALVNLAGENIFGRWTKSKKRRILESRLSVGKALLQVLQQVDRKPAVFIQASAVGYYGSSDEPLDESSPAGEGFLSDVCGQWESSTDAAELLRVRHIIIRSATVLGKDGGAFPRILKPFKYCVGGPIGSGNQWFSFIHLLDEVRAIQFLLENEEARGVYNLCAPHACTNREFSSAISRSVHRPMLFGASAFTMKLLYGQLAEETVLASQHVQPKRLEQLGFHFLFPTVEQAVADLVKN